MHVKVVPGVSAETVTVAHPVLATGDSGSAVVNATVTSPVYQPFRPRVPVTIGVTTGGVASTTTAKVATGRSGRRAAGAVSRDARDGRPACRERRAGSRRARHDRGGVDVVGGRRERVVDARAGRGRLAPTVMSGAVPSCGSAVSTKACTAFTIWPGGIEGEHRVRCRRSPSPTPAACPSRRSGRGSPRRSADDGWPRQEPAARARRRRREDQRGGTGPDRGKRDVAGSLVVRRRRVAVGVDGEVRRLLHRRDVGAGNGSRPPAGRTGLPHEFDAAVLPVAQDLDEHPRDAGRIVDVRDDDRVRSLTRWP